MRVLVPLLFVMVVLYWLLCLLYFIFVVHFEDVVASVVIVGVVSLPFVFRLLFTRGR